MADRIKQIPQKLLEIWKNWSVKQKISSQMVILLKML
jgi:hypothetical protein